MKGRAGPVKIFPYEHSIRSPGRDIFDKIASLSPDSGQNSIILVLYVFPLQEYAK